ncbi:MAG: C4-dicarboxylate ABC transporter permease [Desulfuromonas sp.]|jgi:TRAP-type C4-dicarboxylate transport system permease small subunit|nr:MAG: C4-dicarboxylate ABC transporter permease [Desulfuromonas sp.]
MEEHEGLLIAECETALDRWIVKLGDVVTWLYVIAVLISFYEVIMRYFFNSPTVWVHETTTAIVGIAMAYGGIYCFSNDSHISVHIVRDRLPKHWQKRIAIFVDCLVLVFAVGGSYAMYYMTTRAILTPAGDFYMQRSGSAMNSYWPTVTKLFILFVFVILVLQAFLHLLKKIRSYREEE